MPPLTALRDMDAMIVHNTLVEVFNVRFSKSRDSRLGASSKHLCLHTRAHTHTQTVLLSFTKNGIRGLLGLSFMHSGRCPT
eukprot:1074792-Pelagomonas_calceolata.AAC.3